MGVMVEYETDHDGLPPFPEDVPTAPLLRLSLSKLIEGDDEEDQRLWHACTELGFFYLQLDQEADSQALSGHLPDNVKGSGVHRVLDRRVESAHFVKDAERLFEVANEVFALPIEEKARYDLKEKGSYFGYKGYGSGVVDAAGTKDRNEFYNVRLALFDHDWRRFLLTVGSCRFPKMTC